ncbi:hypothetical protein PMAYCL1PPCAC_21237 [Pristionchus mayeri]|uniref:Uncharacterized protein n=1 Tax=Pristionchus mayeri TaxID=1317129 RepID=A0AAN5I3T8_9BILA|nr:hypothetical protein PMAYCL1PPCAC_21237 [Pristionchus mayeri]
MYTIYAQQYLYHLYKSSNCIKHFSQIPYQSHNSCVCMVTEHNSLPPSQSRPRILVKHLKSRKYTVTSPCLPSRSITSISPRKSPGFVFFVMPKSVRQCTTLNMPSEKMSVDDFIRCSSNYPFPLSTHSESF